MRTYNQYCPIARASEILAERWTPIILRNLLAGYRTFNAIAEGAPGVSRALLTKRLRELERFGVVTITPKPDGHGSFYDLTEAGTESARVIEALATWGDRWTEVLDEHADVGFILWSWVESYVRREALPDRRVVVRIDSVDHRGRSHTDWLLIEDGSMEACAFDPGHGDDVVVTIDDPVVFARWHLGLVDWGTVLRSRGARLTGARDLCRALPTWNAAPAAHRELRMASQPA